MLKEGDRLTVVVSIASKLEGGDFAVARMSADDRSTVCALESEVRGGLG